MRCLWGRSRPIPHFTDPSYYLRAVSRSLAQFGKAVRADIDASAAGGDAGTADVFTEISPGDGQQLWLLEAHHCGSR
jgi:DNA-binding ferritin-like protein